MKESRRCAFSDLEHLVQAHINSHTALTRLWCHSSASMTAQIQLILEQCFRFYENVFLLKCRCVNVLA